MSRTPAKVGTGGNVLSSSGALQTQASTQARLHTQRLHPDPATGQEGQHFEPDLLLVPGLAQKISALFILWVLMAQGDMIKT